MQKYKNTFTRHIYLCNLSTSHIVTISKLHKQTIASTLDSKSIPHISSLIFGTIYKEVYYAILFLATEAIEFYF